MNSNPKITLLNFLARMSWAAIGAITGARTFNWSLNAIIICAIIGFFITPIMIVVFTAGVASFIRPTYSEQRNLDIWTNKVIPITCGIFILFGMMSIIALIVGP
jgi:hypothetical protein